MPNQYSKAFMASLKGLKKGAAMKRVKAAGHKPHAVPRGTAVAACVWPNTVFLWLSEDGKTVEGASSGDPLRDVD